MTTRPWPPRDDAAYRAEAAAKLDPDLLEAFGSVRAMIFDADGVLTRGNILYGPDGEALKEFDTRDGFGLALARTAGVKLALLTGRRSPIAVRRAEELRFSAVRQARFDKQAAMIEILEEIGCEASESLYMGDDLIDIPALDLAGLPVTVPGAPDDVRGRCRYVTTAEGGAGAVREVCALVLMSGGLYGKALADLAAGAWMQQTGGEGQ